MVSDLSSIVMGTNHDTTGSCIGIITKSNASCYIFWVIRDLYSS